MMSLKQPEEDAIPKMILQRLSRTLYACSALSQLMSRPANSVYRGFLSHSFSQDRAVVETIIIKYSTDSGAANIPIDGPHTILEESLLKSLAASPPPTNTPTVIKAPRLYLFDQETNIQVLEDFHATNGFKSVLFSSEAEALLPGPSPFSIGQHLGSWLRSFHIWASTPEQAPLRAQIWQNDPMRKTKYRITYGSFLKVLENFPDLLEDYRTTLETIQDAMVKEFEKPSTEGDKGWGLVHGDFWSGNILLPNTPWQESPTQDKPNKLFIIDWEYSQFGHRSYDLGQIVGDLYERKVYNNLERVDSVMEGVIDGYGELSDELAFRTAVYVGVHLINWYKRRPKQGPRMVHPEVVVAGLTLGRDFIIRGWKRDRRFFERSALASLFLSKLRA